MNEEEKKIRQKKLQKERQKRYYEKNKKEIIINKRLYARGRKKEEPKYKDYLNLITQKSKIKKQIQDAIKKLNEVKEYKLNIKLAKIEKNLDEIRLELNIVKKCPDDDGVNNVIDKET